MDGEQPASETPEVDLGIVPDSEAINNWATYYKAYQLVWNCKWKESEQLLKPKLQTDPWSGYLYFYVAFWRALRINTQEHFEQAHMRCDRLQSFVENAQSAASSAEGLTEAQKKAKHIELTILLGLIFSARGILHALRASSVKAGYNIRKGWKSCEEAVELIAAAKAAHSDFVLDSHAEATLDFGLGIFQFGTSLAPKDLQWLASTLGFSAKRTTVELMRSYEREGYMKNEAALGLSMIYQFIYSDFTKGLQIFDDLKLYYTDSPVMNLFFGTFIRLSGDTKKALNLYQNARMCAEGLQECGQLAATASYQTAQCHMMMGEYAEAVKHFEIYMKETINNENKAYAALSYGLCLWQLTPGAEERVETLFLNKMIRLFKPIPQWKQEGDPYGDWAVKQTARFLKIRKFDRWQEIFLLALNFHEAKNYELAWKTLLPAKELIIEPAFRAANLWVSFLWLKGSCMRGMGNHVEAKYSFEKALHLESKTNTDGLFAIVYSCLELAEMANQIQDIEEAKKWSTRAKTYSGYDWEAAVQTRLHFLDDSITVKEIAKNEAENTATIQLFNVGEAVQVQQQANSNSSDLLQQMPVAVTKSEEQ